MLSHASRRIQSVCESGWAWSSRPPGASVSGPDSAMMRPRRGSASTSAPAQWGARNAGDGNVPSDQEPRGLVGVSRRAPPSTARRLFGPGGPVRGVERPAHYPVPAFGGSGLDLRCPCDAHGRRRASCPSGPSDRVRAAVDPGRASPAPIGDAARASLQRAPTGGELVTGLGPACRELRRDDLERPSRPGRGGRGMAPARGGSPAAPGSSGPMVTAGRTGVGGMGTRRLGLRRGVRRDLRGRLVVVVRHAGGGALLLCGGRAGGASGTGVVEPEARAADPAGHRRVLRGHGGPPGLAGAGILAGLGAG